MRRNCIKSFTVGLLLLVGTQNVSAQACYNKIYLDSLDHISNGNTISKHFARLYLNTILITNEFAETQPENVRHFIFSLDSIFIPLFFVAHEKFISHNTVPSNWAYYYKFDSLNPLQYQFMGMNAHINGDLHLALVEKFGYDSLKKYSKQLLSFQKVLNKIVDSIYTTTKDYPHLKLFHCITLGTDQIMARKMVWHWRRRQVALALLYYKKKHRYLKRKTHLQKLMLQWDERAIKYFN